MSSNSSNNNDNSIGNNREGNSGNNPGDNIRNNAENNPDIRYSYLIDNLNNDEINIRLGSLNQLHQLIEAGEILKPERGNDVNNHIHTTYSFSPYSPTKAIWMAYSAGLVTAGIMDHDSIGGAEEFIEAGKYLNIATTIGVECRADFSDTPLNGKKINNPDQSSIAYVALHGIPHTRINHVREYFTPYTRERNKRNACMVDKINGLFKPFNIALDFEKDVASISKVSDGGSITERHILFALAEKLVGRFGKGAALVDFLKNKMNISLKAKLEEYLLDSENQFYEYDLLGVLKSDLISSIYMEAKKECPDIRELLEFANTIGAISAYAYLGDVTNSVTGDKKTQKFEDDYIEQLFEVLKELGFNAVTYMPSRNTITQLKRVKALCNRYDLLQISGEDINSPRQSFVCKAMRNDEFSNLIDSTWALIGHEKAATENIDDAMFSAKTIQKYGDLNERIAIYKEIGKSIGE
ncbi:MAG TPA: PHP domain-containing protein [Clostridiales bacterium]|nr:PHP domain-containing protein [Clostridiales bacterium]